MKKFIIKFVLFCLPFILSVVLFSYLDLFKVLRDYNDYYHENPIMINRGVVCVKTLEKYRKEQRFDSFIFGNSRSQAFKCESWAKYLQSNAVPFHFDAYSESVYGLSKKVEYLDAKGDKIKNALVVVDRDLLTRTMSKDGYLYTLPPSISNENPIKFYMEFYKAQMNLRFNVAYFDYFLFGKYRNYMKTYIRNSKYWDTANPINCDIFYGKEKHIETDYDGYYNYLISMGVFYKRPKESISSCNVSDLEITQLKIIKKVFSKHGTKYKILVSPMYDQIPLEKEQLTLLKDIFGDENVYDFSGVNEYTQSIYNYYETSHYRPHVADRILESIYSSKTENLVYLKSR